MVEFHGGMADDVKALVFEADVPNAPLGCDDQYQFRKVFMEK